MLIILDRDGVINFDSVDYVKSPDEWIPIPGSIEAIAQLSKAGNTIVIATNQSGVNRGLFSLKTLEKIHEKLIRAVESFGGKITKIYFCPHAPDENCHCRKPKPGMLQQIQKDFTVKNTEMIYVGDSVKDFEVAQAVGCKFILVRTGNGKKTEKQLTKIKLPVFENLLAVTQHFA
ncbi:MAG: D-glycero-beta-D-manno-heptose-1,7-bisphosphate 7-phosphatase [Gammaproteobacteria bacterium RIFCSPHIGHO2_12_FULL_38_11]|nr:MAG: D-glycero-beta-D-manno-heptose-1,7-bisphosphate 7-phosphatase [Gammaproteobacteria bacterium RIFCSPHIGHO2_12_FULL_38_11]